MKFKLRRYYLYYFGRALAFLFCLLPIQVGIRIGSELGKLAFYILPRYRRSTLDNLRKYLDGERTERELKDIAKNVFSNMGKNAAELVNFPKIDAANIDRFVTIRNPEVMEDAFKKGKGIILLTAHFGNWELLAATLRIKNYPGATIGRKIYFKLYDEYLNYLRKTHDVNVIYRDASPKGMLKVLKRNEIMGILADQDVDSVEGVFVNFFGHPAYTPIGPVALAKATGASIIPAFIVRDNGRHDLIIEKPIELVDTGDKEKDVVINTQKWSDVVESYIRKYPDHWVWMHKRWKTKV